MNPEMASDETVVLVFNDFHESDFPIHLATTHNQNPTPSLCLVVNTTLGQQKTG